MLPCRVASVEALGHGTTTHLISLAQAQDDSASHTILSAAALAKSISTAHGNSSGLATGRVTAAEDARQCLLKAPMLSELHDWTSWHLLFEQELGGLYDFLQEQGALADSPLCYQSHLMR